MPEIAKGGLRPAFTEHIGSKPMTTTQPTTLDFGLETPWKKALLIHISAAYCILMRLGTS
ncbi:hypothetical protein N7E02_17050 [Aliirhizobium terrae]|uniref:hypothetical protein n=1 Tax=Terrirhizobium terrae TaxID=2926709 RepID=UPI002576276A|nr:hypothetical protein [Rhizobium sp. CC-CFT758]WJH41927.1 hypothetical protein N7E02_17050 [Rhizobium sp. CC-CFT758]